MMQLYMFCQAQQGDIRLISELKSMLDEVFVTVAIIPVVFIFDDRLI